MKKIKWGVLGTGYICWHDTLPGMEMAENCEMYAIASRTREKAEEFQARYGFAVAYDSYDALLEDPAVEAVYIPLPNHLHKEWTIKALQHKKHVLCEKPLAANAADAEEMFRVAEENGVYLMEAFAYQHSPLLAALEQELADGTIGDVRCMDSQFLTSDYDISNIRMRKATLGGAMYDLGVYPASLILRLLGDNVKTVKAVALMDEERIDRLTTVVLDYGGEKRAMFSTGMCMAKDLDQSAHGFQIHGTKGTIRGDGFTFNGCGALRYWVCPIGGQPVLKEVEVPQNYMLEVAQLGRCIAEGEKPFVTKAFSLACAKVTDAVLKEIGY